MGVGVSLCVCLLLRWWWVDNELGPEEMAALAPALGSSWTGAEVGPGLGIQLRFGAQAGRLLFVGHKDKYSGNGTGLWLSDDGGVHWHVQHHFAWMNEAQLGEVDGAVFVLLRNNQSCACFCLSFVKLSQLKRSLLLVLYSQAAALLLLPLLMAVIPGHLLSSTQSCTIQQHKLQ